MTPRFLSPLDNRLVNEQKGLWELLDPLMYYSAVLKRTVVVPRGFVTDYASVPRLPLVYLAAGGKGDRAAVVHDWLYSSQMVERATADAVLREALIATGYPPSLAQMFFLAVRAFGGSHWQKPNQSQPEHVANAMRAVAPAAA